MQKETEFPHITSQRDAMKGFHSRKINMAETKKNEMTEIGIISKEKTSKERRIEIVVGICGSVIPIICIVFVVNMSGVLREEDNFVYYAIGALCLGLIILPMLNLLKLEKRWKQAETLGAKPKNGLGKA